VARSAFLPLQSARAFAAVVVTTCAVACSAGGDGDSDLAADDAPNASSSESAFSGALPSLRPVKPLSSWPKVWDQPASTGVVEQNGYCGAAAAANLFRWYGREVSPHDAIARGCWSYVGTMAETLGSFVERDQPDLGCRYEKLPGVSDPLAWVRSRLTEGKPIIVQFMTGGLNAHWVTVVGVFGKGADPKLILTSWGRYYEAQWSGFEDAWRNAWGGPFPHITCDAVSPFARVMRIDE
jgi:hypothetical protein